MVESVNRSDDYWAGILRIGMFAGCITYLLIVCLEVFDLSLVFLRLQYLTDKVDVYASVRDSQLHNFPFIVNA